MIEELILNKLQEIYQIFMEYNKKVFFSRYSNLNINEVHTIECIGRTERANVTKITDHLKITKGGVTKITTKLMAKGYISSYQTEENKKEKYFALTKKGTELFNKHEILHKETMDRDRRVFEHFNEEEKKVIFRFLDAVKKDFDEKME